MQDLREHLKGLVADAKSRVFKMQMERDASKKEGDDTMSDGGDKEGDDDSYNTLDDVEQEEHHADDVEQDEQPRRSQRTRMPAVSSPWVLTVYSRKKFRKG